jgi:hypothetical protein
MCDNKIPLILLLFLLTVCMYESWKQVKIQVSTEFELAELLQAGTCHYDGHEFQGQPYPVIKGFDSKRGVFLAYDCVMCSPGCGKAWIVDSNRSTMHRECEWSSYVWKNRFNVKPPIKRAPSRTELYKRGKRMTIQQFRKDLIH